MDLDQHACDRARRSRDARFDDEAYWRIWSGYIDDLKEIGVDLNRAAVHLLAGLTGTVQDRARVWVSSYLVLPRLIPDDPTRWQGVQYVPETGGLQPTTITF